MIWGIIPAAGHAMRLQPLAFSKELLPVGSRIDEHGIERPKAVSEYLIDRMAHAGAQKLCFVISPWKSDILQYYGGAIGHLPIAYAIQNQAAGLCDAIFSALPFIGAGESAFIGLPDTIWFPEDALAELPGDRLACLLFEVDRPQLFDAVALDGAGRVRRIEVKSDCPTSRWIWGAWRAPGHVLHELHDLWRARSRRDEYLGTLIDAWIAAGGIAQGVRAGERYVDVGTLGGYREAMRLLGSHAARKPSLRPTGKPHARPSL